MRLGIGADDFIDGIDLHRLTAPSVGHNRVLVASLIDQYGLGDLRKKIDDRSATEPQSLFVDGHFQSLMTAVLLEWRDHEQQFGLRSESCSLQFREPFEA